MRIHFIGSTKLAAQQAVQQLIDRYGQNDLTEADYVVAVGGDGTALSALYQVMQQSRQPVFSMRLPDSVGALGNTFDGAGLAERLETAARVTFRPLKAEVSSVNGAASTVFGINEIAVTRQRLQAAKLTVRLSEVGPPHSLVGDGLLVATSLGSTGYNRSAGGPRLPLRSALLLAVTGLAVQRPVEWCNSVVEGPASIDLEVLDPVHRPVRVETSAQEVRDVAHITISQSQEFVLTLLLEGR